MAEKIKVLVVEDSIVFRNLLVSYINRTGDMQVVAVANDPFEARDAIIEHNPDVMTLDVELPKMSGIEFLRKLMPQFPVRTIVISSLSNKVFDALQAGAVDFVAKPTNMKASAREEFLSVELPEKIRIAAKSRLKDRYRTAMLPKEAPIAAGDEGREIADNDISDVIIAIGASTGGTEATTAIIERLGPDIPAVLVTQHMPEGFTRMYADRLNNSPNIRVKVKEAENGEIIQPGVVYIAPGGDRHMQISKKGSQYSIFLKNADKVNGHRPSVDVLFESMAREVGKNAVGVILTGMGGDGAQGLLAMRQMGARTIGQDESTCVVYGMPKVAYEIGAVETQEKILDIPQKIYYYIDQIKRKRR